MLVVTQGHDLRLHLDMQERLQAYFQGREP